MWLRSRYIDCATGCLDDLDCESRQGQEMFSSPKAPDRLWIPVQPPIQWVPRSYPEVMLTGLECNLSLPGTDAIKNVWSYDSVPLACLLGVDRYFICINITWAGLSALNLNIEVRRAVMTLSLGLRVSATLLTWWSAFWRPRTLWLQTATAA